MRCVDGLSLSVALPSPRFAAAGLSLHWAASPAHKSFLAEQFVAYGLVDALDVRDWVLDVCVREVRGCAVVVVVPACVYRIVCVCCGVWSAYWMVSFSLFASYIHNPLPPALLIPR